MMMDKMKNDAISLFTFTLTITLPMSELKQKIEYKKMDTRKDTKFILSP